MPSLLFIWDIMYDTNVLEYGGGLLRY